MLIDGREIAPGSRVEADICIVGGGPAGSTLARALDGCGVSVCMLESGGFDPDPWSQSLLEGDIAADGFHPADHLAAARRAQFGGSAMLWGIQVQPGEETNWARYVVPAPVDFEELDWVPNSGWPFTREELDAFYDRAQSICRLGPARYDAEAWATDSRRRPLLEGDSFDARVFQFGPASVFGEGLESAVAASANLSVYVNSTVVDLQRDATGRRIARATVSARGASPWRVFADTFVLAAGAVENARILLLEREQGRGSGSPSDTLGGFLMDHPAVLLGILQPESPLLFRAAGLYDLHRSGGTAVMGHLSASEPLRRRERILGSCIMLVPRPSARDRVDRTAAAAWRGGLALRPGIGAREATRRVATAIRGVDDIAVLAYRRVLRPEWRHSPSRGGWSRYRNPEKRFSVFEVYAQLEQQPDPANRVMLTAAVDSLDRRRVELRCALTDLDRRTISRMRDVFAEEAEAAGLGRLEPAFGPSDVPVVWTAYHHMGTTRMHSDPQQGVVDENCRVHGTENLFVAGSSVFPTGLGYSNPTLTIVALSLRLASHLSGETLLTTVTGDGFLTNRTEGRDSP